MNPLVPFAHQPFQIVTDRNGRRRRLRSAFPRIASRSKCKQHAVKREHEYPDSRGIPLKIDGHTVQGVVLPSGRKYAINSSGAWVRVEETNEP